MNQPRALTRQRPLSERIIETLLFLAAAVGVVTTLVPKAPFDPTYTLALVCGPEIMMRFAAAELQKRGISPERIYVSMECNMKCAIGFCGHCQFGPNFVCRDGPVFAYAQVDEWVKRWEV